MTKNKITILTVLIIFILSTFYLYQKGMLRITIFDEINQIKEDITGESSKENIPKKIIEPEIIIPNEIIAQKQGLYYKKVIATEKEFTFSDTLKENDFFYKWNNEISAKYIRWKRPICKWMPRKESCEKPGFWYIDNEYKIWDNTYQYITDLKNRDKFYIFKNDELVLTDTLEMVWAYSPKETYILNDKLLFIYTKRGEGSKVLYNTFYDTENINTKYSYTNITWFFIYKEKEGFILDNSKIFFNEEVLPYNFTHIQNKACCTAPSLFKIYDNWALIFANKISKTTSDFYFEIIELDLDDFLDIKKET